MDFCRFFTIIMDVTNQTQIDEAVKTVESIVLERGLYGLFNNAGIVTHGNIEGTPMKVFRDSMEVNYFGTIAVTKAFLPLIRKAKGDRLSIRILEPALYFCLTDIFRKNH